MKIIYKESFVSRLERQVEYIAINNPATAIKFKNALIAKLKLAIQNPYLFRKSIFFDNPEIRDIIFKGYTIVFRVRGNIIEVFGFIKYQNKPID